MRDKRTINAWRCYPSLWTLKQYVRHVLATGDYPAEVHAPALRWAITKGMVYTDGLGSYSLRAVT